MDYKAVKRWMFSKLPMYQRQGAVAYKKDLSRTKLLAKHLNHPEKSFKSVHVAGTNGKGSTSHMIAAILIDAGYNVGLYTSPHLKDYRERVRVNGKKISSTSVVEFINENRFFLEKNQLSFFEMTVGLAFQYFSKKGVDIAVIEVGMGGRLDSTNIIFPEVSVITNISLDHMKFLGNSLEKIAREKAGIIKKHTPVVIGQSQSSTRAVFLDKAREMDSEISFADELIDNIVPCSLSGVYQKSNIKTVLQTIEVLKNRGYTISENNIKNGLLNVENLTGIRGRWETISCKPKIICDIAHNKDALSLIIDQLMQEKFQNLHMVIGFVNDKSVEDLVSIFPRQAYYYFCKPDIERGIESNQLKDIFLKRNYRGKAYLSVRDALTAAKSQSLESDLIFVGGSTFVVSEVI